MGATIKSMFEKQRAMSAEFEHVQEVLGKIETRVHPLNFEMSTSVQSSLSYADANNVIFTRKERPDRQVRFLNLNSLMLPKIPKNPNYKTGFQYERLSDMFLNVFCHYDIICLQEVLGICSGDLKEVIISFAHKAGFFYQACQPSTFP